MKSGGWWLTGKNLLGIDHRASDSHVQVGDGQIPTVNSGSVTVPSHGTDVPSVNGDLTEQSYEPWISLFIAVGVLARIVRYYLCFPLWDDECFLCVNFIGRSYAELLTPLDYHQVAPVLFLWIERTVVRCFGFSEYALRLVPFVCSIASLFLFRRVARQLVSGPALLYSVAIFAVSYPGIRYSAEAKPYGTDMLLSLVMLSLVLEWLRHRDFRYLFGLAAMMPIALGVSYPAVFAAGGLSLVVGTILLRQSGTTLEWRGWLIWIATLASSFTVWFLLVGRVQSGAEAEFMGDYWKQNFPPIREPWLLPFWLLKTHASDFLAYPVGGPNWASSLTLLLCLVGAWHLARQKRFVWLGLIVAPASLHFLAAALQKYPYGGHVKFSQYLAPMICCLTAVGLARTLNGNTVKHFVPRHFVPRLRSLLRRRGTFLQEAPDFSTDNASPRGLNGLNSDLASASWLLVWSCSIFAAIGFGTVTRDLANPFKTRSDDRARSFARAFWVGTHFAEEVVCLKSDRGLDFVPDQHRELSWSAHYLCNRAIEVSRFSLRPGDEHRVSSERPLRCVLYRDARYELDRSRLERWLQEMLRRYTLVAHESIPFPRFAKDERRLVTMEYVDSYKFVPRTDEGN